MRRRALGASRQAGRGLDELAALRESHQVERGKSAPGETGLGNALLDAGMAGAMTGAWAEVGAGSGFGAETGLGALTEAGEVGEAETGTGSGGGDATADSIPGVSGRGRGGTDPRAASPASTANPLESGWDIELH